MNGRLPSRLFFATVLLSDGNRLETLGQVARNLTLFFSPHNMGVLWIRIPGNLFNSIVSQTTIIRFVFNQRNLVWEGSVSVSYMLDKNVWSR